MGVPEFTRGDVPDAFVIVGVFSLLARRFCFLIVAVKAVLAAVEQFDVFIAKQQVLSLTVGGDVGDAAGRQFLAIYVAGS